jgi:tetrapyrrole methylase family protein/MazG family protein
VYFRTGLHPAREAIEAVTRVHTFDLLYEEQPDFEAVYEAIVEEILTRGRLESGVVYAVPGDPTVGEATVAEIRTRALEASLRCDVHPAVSFVEPCLDLVSYDALDGLCIADGLEIAAGFHPPFSPDRPALIGQVYSRLVAGDVKLTLMNQYPDEHPVQLIHGAGTRGAKVEALPLFKVDRSGEISGMTALWVPPLGEKSAFESFQNTVAQLRAPEGCPWDREQTHGTLRQNLLEETYEALEAIDAGDADALREELGDLLLQVVLHAQIATEGGRFSMPDVIAGIQRKIVGRHPHVFGDVEVETADEVIHNWERIKATEREGEGDGGGVLDGIPISLPALAQAHEVQVRAARHGFDWPQIQGVIDKIDEELRELRSAGEAGRKAAEIGDLFFTLVNYSRWLKVDPESATRGAISRFRRRFSHIERQARASGRQLDEMDLESLDALWEAGKSLEE